MTSGALPTQKTKGGGARFSCCAGGRGSRDINAAAATNTAAAASTAAAAASAAVAQRSSGHVLADLGVELVAPELVAGQYDLGVVVGSGHFAEIREAVRRSDGEKVAIKFIDKKDGDDKFFKMVYRESATRTSCAATPCWRLAGMSSLRWSWPNGTCSRCTSHPLRE